MRALFAAGGTGGHVFPAIAIADEIMRRDPANRVLFIGTAKGVAQRAVRDAGYRFCAVSGGGLSGGLSGGVSGLARTVAGTVRAFFIARRFRPDVAVGTGGYGSVPGAAAALALGVPLAVCEQNSAPGLANRALAVAARRVFLSFPHTAGAGRKGRHMLVGNPVRRDVETAARQAVAEKLISPCRFPRSGSRALFTDTHGHTRTNADGQPAGSRALSRHGGSDKRQSPLGQSPPWQSPHGQPAGSGVFTLFVMGGSQGAAALNRTVPPAVALYQSRAGGGVRVVHQTGVGAEKEVSAAYRRAGIEARVFDFSPAVADFYAGADLVVSRAGAGAVAEIALFRAPSILIPYPFAARGHQRENALMMERAGASVMIEEDGLTKEAVAKTLEKLLNWNALEEMSRSAARVAAPGAAGRVADEIEKIVCG